MYKETRVLKDRVLNIIHQSNPSKEDLKWLCEYRDRKIRFLDIQGHLLNKYIAQETFDLISLIDFKLYFHTVERMN